MGMKRIKEAYPKTLKHSYYFIGKSVERMKRTPIKKVSKKQAKENAELKKLVTILKVDISSYDGYRTTYKSELSGQIVSDIEPHHIYGRLGKHMLSPFEIILVTREQHMSIHKHNNREQKLKLEKLIYDTRITQGFKPTDY